MAICKPVQLVIMDVTHKSENEVSLFFFHLKKHNFNLTTRFNLTFINQNIQAVRSLQFKWVVLKCKRVNQTNLTILFKLQNVVNLMPLIPVVSPTAQAAVIQRQKQIAIWISWTIATGIQLKMTTLQKRNNFFYSFYLETNLSPRNKDKRSFTLFYNLFRQLIELFFFTVYIE